MVQTQFTESNTWFNYRAFLGGNHSRKLAHNTRVRLVADSDIIITLHDNVIIRYLKRGAVIVYDGGWQSVTTKQRINQFSPIGVGQKDWVWYDHNGDKFKSGTVYNRYHLWSNTRVAGKKSEANTRKTWAYVWDSRSVPDAVRLEEITQYYANKWKQVLESTSLLSWRAIGHGVEPTRILTVSYSQK